MDKTTHMHVGKGNILLAAEYRTPRSGNFIASLLDLAEALRESGRDTVFLFPARKERYPWAEWLCAHGFSVYFLEDGKTAEEKLAFVKDLVDRQIGRAHV